MLLVLAEAEKNTNIVVLFWLKMKLFLKNVLIHY